MKGKEAIAQGYNTSFAFRKLQVQSVGRFEKHILSVVLNSVVLISIPNLAE